MVRSGKFIILLVVTICLLSCNGKDKTEGNSAVPGVNNVFTVANVNKRENLSPEFSWQNTSGEKFNFDAYRGKLTLVNFWATWCGPCKAELPDLVALSKEFQPWGLKVLGISIDQGRDVVVQVSKFVEEHKINYDIVIDDGNLQKAFGNIRGVPTTFIIDKDGKVLDSFMGARSKAFFLSKINQYIN
jgi:cytochrome c biogenesis protein CcmG, thiol:disulfide interchange protein DsbE